MIGGPARLNVFQKTQRLWDTQHPYNAAQAMELVGDLSAEHVAISFNTALRDLGLGEFVCDGRSYFVESLSGNVDIAPLADDFETCISREMNRPFPADRSFPFRPFDLTDDGRRFVGLVYQHWVADSVSIRMLMRQWLLRIVDTARQRPLRLPASGLLGTFGPASAGWSVLSQTASLVGMASRMKSMRRVDAKSDDRVAVLLRRGPDGLIDAIKPKAKAVGATIGDVFLAAAASACDELGPNHATTRRPDLCMGTIVDLRARGGNKAADVFGLYLGFTQTPFAARDLADFNRLLARTAAMRRAGLARKSAEASQLNLALGYTLGTLMGPKRLREFYRKRFPLAGGLSSVNMTPGWAGEHHPSPLVAYHRVSPTGPMLPLVLTPTTLGRTLAVCCTHRTALMNSERTARLVEHFFGKLTHFAG